MKRVGTMRGSITKGKRHAIRHLSMADKSANACGHRILYLYIDCYNDHKFGGGGGSPPHHLEKDGIAFYKNTAAFFYRSGF